jgi:hypothetical protein
MHCRTHIWVALVAVGIAAILNAPLAVADGPKEDRRDTLFVMTNSAASDRGNEVVMYERDRDGNLTLIGSFPTGRLESGQPQRGAGPSPTSTVFGAPIPALGTSPDGDGVLNGFRVRQNGTLVPLGIGVSYPSPDPFPEPECSGNHAIDVRVVGRSLYFLPRRLGMVDRLTIERNGDLVGLTNFGGLSPGVEPFAGLNPGINDFLERWVVYLERTENTQACTSSMNGT